ncbi:uncharacterized protein LOC100571649 [Acyrthosiphon pisum]|uniref:Uncharacterized protein n=1 Tax=Acyrthosiphon pisum TaxID=7029 RepID=A0A8R2F9H2_ACYPI|nr:uncharacterized protein LOC100571649 [Acyrthosiphon pisum]XP_003245680.1 uncharacterized protein LOC100571649 [Acyrthosiphon pisum]XP_008184785.1 uncharacterized protein LOC100571649 [Acyrthosiphon pisum]XP_008184787.1 uncharacterized protein LOC100571649 [Acyrthosiphon pisum]XP_016661322.1 uncharacterized protein LOC100571649 [Acyrthosiphon pisum]|eukprot:XP_003245679.1 PREDICTED: uncharacterized protein LOC100571649 [Acyrthosiphon pisum]
MSVCDCWASFKFSQIILCLSCLLYKRWSDAEATRLFYFFEKSSREWPLLNNITRNGAGSLFADVTFGGYIIICVALYIAYLMGELKNSKKTESFLLVIGAALFIAVGCLVLTAVDSVPGNLIVNALVLGTLSIVTGMVFVLDTCLSNRRNDKESHLLPKNTRYGDIARTRAAVDGAMHANGTNGVHANGTNGVHANGTNGVHANGMNGVHANGMNGVHVNGINGVLKRETAVENKQKNGLLRTAANGRTVETKNESVQTTTSRDRGRPDEDGDDVDGVSAHQYGRRYLDDRGFDVSHGHRHTEWYDTDMDLPKMKKLEINVPAEESPDYRRRFVNVKSGIKLQSPSITSTVHNQQESPKEENEHEVKNARVPYVFSEKKRPTRPTDLPLKSPVERVNDSLQKSVKSRFYFGANTEEPKSPNDPGYVLHTVSRWEEQPAAAVPQNGYKNFKRSQV